ncbi:hypothetical protein ABIB57_002514 [Devosia sp. UYZn731]|uniref:hypothetical protein n=1 Tax=Devosia sp. UYZn731 TaxID=3156345 RepID=UPI0033960B0A
MAQRNTYLAELTRALMVLALILLNLGHQTVPAQAGPVGYQSVGAYTAFCGSPDAPDRTGHAACHACRIGAGADLPQPPVYGERLALCTEALVYLAPTASARQQWPTTLQPIRGPPSLA